MHIAEYNCKMSVRAILHNRWSTSLRSKDGFQKISTGAHLLSHSAEVMRVVGEMLEAKGPIVIRPESSFSESGMTKFKSPYLLGHPAKK